MSTRPVAITASGMVTGVGLSAPASCAAIRCAIDNFQETTFVDRAGEWIIGSAVTLGKPWRGTRKLATMLAMVIDECVSGSTDLDVADIPVLVNVAEEPRPGRLEDLDQVIARAQAELGTGFHESSGLLRYGRVGAVVALLEARRLIYELRIPRVLVAGVDSLLVSRTLAAFDERDRLLTSVNSNGFVPGEAAAAVLVEAPRARPEPQLVCVGMGCAVEGAGIESETPLRADGLVDAVKQALAEAGCTLGALTFRITDISGEQYAFKESALALSRILRERNEGFDLWHPADCVGEVGAAAGMVGLGVALAATRKAYAPGNRFLFHSGNDDGRRAAAVCTHEVVKAA